MDEARKTMTVPEAGRVYFCLGRNASYEAARRGDIPTIKVGRLLRLIADNVRSWEWESFPRREPKLARERLGPVSGITRAKNCSATEA